MGHWKNCSNKQCVPTRAIRGCWDLTFTSAKSITRREMGFSCDNQNCTVYMWGSAMGRANVVLLDDQRTAIGILEMQPNVLSLLSELINIVIVAAYTNCLTLRKEEEVEWGCKAWVKKNQCIFRFSNHSMYVWPSNPLYYNAAALIYTPRVRWRDFTVPLEFLQRSN